MTATEEEEDDDAKTLTPENDTVVPLIAALPPFVGPAIDVVEVDASISKINRFPVPLVEAFSGDKVFFGDLSFSSDWTFFCDWSFSGDWTFFCDWSFSGD
jgi:hypothetical protein